MHVPVLLNEVIKYLNPQPNQNFIDCTIGRAGHAFKILELIGTKGALLGIDLWEGAIAELANLKSQTRAQNKFCARPSTQNHSSALVSNVKNRLILVNDNFANLKQIIQKYNFYPVHGVLLDLGLSTDLLEKSGRGFSFMRNEFLDMRYGSEGITAYEIINQRSEKELNKIFQKYGEERRAKAIARNIVKFRKKKKIVTTQDLVRSIFFQEESLSKFKIKTLARIFQAVRIDVNNELGNLKIVLPQITNLLIGGGRVAVISYHSLEDQIVKEYFKNEKRLKILSKKPIRPSREEILKNPRARSAKLRVAEKITNN